jgi:branched-subunit amino acid aminotransferase/4-amino-4-deoxychorismate lyase
MNDRTLGPVLINGVAHDAADARISVFDIGFQRGYGCFEAMRSYGGSLFRLDRHLDRLISSSTHLRISLPDKETLAGWCHEVADSHDGVLRIYVTGGLDAKHPGTGNSIIAFIEPLPDIPEAVRLDVLDAPWHADGHQSELTGAKTLSYGPNLAATIAARSRGFDDAALIGTGDVVLEGPTFSLGWVSEGAMCTPGLDRHILASITREATIEVADELGVPVREETFHRADLLDADEVFVMSTVREVLPVVAVGGATFVPGPVTAALRSGFHRLVASERR